MRTSFQPLVEMIRTVYQFYTLDSPEGMFDATVNVRRVRGARSLLRPQVELVCDGARDLEPFPADTSLPLLEWGTNYALASRLFCYLLLHAGVVERRGLAVLMPAMPGSGKSTLTAALSLRGFRLLSDEFGVVCLDDSRLLPLLRPVALKNESIDVIRGLSSDAVIGPRFPKTHKGTVAHLSPLRSHIDARHLPASPALVLFPQFQENSGVDLEPVSQARAFARLAVNSFNYDALGPDGFEALGRLVKQCSCWQLRYGDLHGAIGAIESLVGSLEPPLPGTQQALQRPGSDLVQPRHPDAPPGPMSRPRVQCD